MTRKSATLLVLALLLAPACGAGHKKTDAGETSHTAPGHPTVPKEGPEGKAQPGPLEAAHCAAWSECGSSLVCARGVCAAPESAANVCANDTECGYPLLCIVQKCRYIGPTACVSDTDCESARVCKDGQCTLKY